VRHAEIALLIVFGVLALLMPYYHDRRVAKAGRSADYRQIVTVVAVTVEFYKVGKGIADEVQCPRALRMAG
jgi:hypothetical protein